MRVAHVIRVDLLWVDLTVFIVLRCADDGKCTYSCYSSPIYILIMSFGIGIVTGTNTFSNQSPQ